MRTVVLLLVALTLPGCAQFKGITQVRQVQKESQSSAKDLLPVQPQTAEVKQDPPKGVLHVRVIDFNSFPVSLQRGVHEEIKCGGGCSKFDVVSSLLDCVGRGQCRESADGVLWVTIIENGKPISEGRLRVAGSDKFEILAGSSVSINAMPDRGDQCQLVLPARKHDDNGTKRLDLYPEW